MRRGVTWSTLAYLAGRALSLVALMVLARLLVPADFGAVAAVTAFLALIEFGSDLGMNATVVYEQERGTSARLNVAFTLNLVLATMLTVAGVLLAPVVAGFFHLSDQADLFRLASLNPVIAALGNIHDSVLLRDMEFRRRTVAILVRGVARGAVAVILAVAGVGAASIVIGMLAGTLAWAVTQWFLTPFRPRLSLERDVARSMASYGAGAASLEVISLITTRADVVVIGRVLGDVALGLYTLAFRLPEMLIESVAWNVSIVAFPALSRQRVEDRHSLGDATIKLLRWQALYAAPVAAALAVTAPALIVVLFGSQWEEAGAVGSALAVMFGISAIAFPLGDVYRALGRQRLLAVINVFQLGILVAAIVAVASSGILAVAWARVGAQAAQTLLVVGFALRLLDVPARRAVAAVGPALAAAAGVTLGAGAVTLAWDSLTLGPLVASLAAGLAGGLIALRLAAPAMLGELRGQLRGRLSRPAPKPAHGAWSEPTPEIVP
jgi:PST family polysaccharide transporter